MGKYHKACHVCHKDFKSNARNTKYCSDDCKATAKKRHTSRGKRRRQYRKDATNRRAESMSRKQAREHCIANHSMSICTRCGEVFKIAELEDHHRDGDPFNNELDNLTLQCKKCHPKSDTEWRKEKDEGQPISDIRKFQQVGVVLYDMDNDYYYWLLPNGKRRMLPQTQVLEDMKGTP